MTRLRDLLNSGCRVSVKMTAQTVLLQITTLHTTMTNDLKGMRQTDPQGLNRRAKDRLSDDGD